MFNSWIFIFSCPTWQLNDVAVMDQLILCLWHYREEKQKERQTEAHKRWLQERQDKKIELERAWKPPGV